MGLATLATLAGAPGGLVGARMGCGGVWKSVVWTESTARGELGGSLGSMFSLLSSEFMTAERTRVGGTWARGADLNLYNSAAPAFCVWVRFGSVRISLLTRLRRRYRGLCHTRLRRGYREGATGGCATRGRAPG